MSISVNTIKRLLWIILGVFALTYLISLNIENHFVVANLKWLSNDFLFAITGGAFASLVVVLVCEIIKYRQLKLATENALLVYLGSLYGQFLIIRSSCKRVLNSEIFVSDNLIQSTCDNATIVVDSINGIDYTLICNTNNKVRDLLNQFKTDKYLVIKNVLINFVYLKVAVWEDGKVLISQGKQNLVTSDCSNTNKVLNKVISQSTTILTYLDQVITQIDNELGNKYQWQSRKQALNTYQDNYISQQLEDYIKEDIIVF